MGKGNGVSIGKQRFKGRKRVRAGGTRVCCREKDCRRGMVKERILKVEKGFEIRERRKLEKDKKK